MNAPAELKVPASPTSVPERQSVDQIVDAARCAEHVGDWVEAETLYGKALERIRAGECIERGPQVMRWLGRVHFERGGYDQAITALEASLVAAQKLNRRQDAALALNSMAIVAQLRGTLEVAEALYQRAGLVAQDIGDEQLCAITEQNLGVLANIRGDLSIALERYQSALERYRRLQDERGAGRVLNNMGMLHVDVGEWTAAELSFNAAYEVADRIGDPATLGKIENNRAELYLKRQQYERARECCERSFRLFTRLGSDSGLASVHRYYGALYRETGKPQMAHVHFSLALKLARACENPLLEAETEQERARLYLNERQHAHALRALNRAHQIFRELDARREILDLQRRLARMHELYVLAAEMWADDAPAAPDKAPRGKRVAELAVRLAEALGYEDLYWLRIGAYLHDIGNSALPIEVLEKRGALSDDEWELVRRHTVIGCDIATELDFPPDVRPMIRNHHEHWDGTGYPDALKGADIPTAARIICIADVFDALTSERSYRPAFSIEQALSIMQSEVGRVFDPLIFPVFKKLMEQDSSSSPPSPPARN